MIFLAVRENKDGEPMGFNCGDSNHARAQWVAETLRGSLSGGASIYGPEMTSGGDFVVTVMCADGTLASVIALVETSVAIWRARGQLG